MLPIADLKRGTIEPLLINQDSEQMLILTNRAYGGKSSDRISSKQSPNQRGSPQKQKSPSQSPNRSQPKFLI